MAAALPLCLLLRSADQASAVHVESGKALASKSGSAANTWDEPQLIHEVHDVPHLCSHTFCILREGGKIELYSKEGSAE